MTTVSHSTNSFVELFKVVFSLSTDQEKQEELTQELEGLKEPNVLRHIQNKISKLSLPDFGFSERKLTSLFTPGIIADSTAYETESLSFHLFGLSRGDGFPLHNHPQMIGISVILYGKVRYRSLTVVSVEDSHSFCRVANEGEIIAPGSLMLTASLGNIHEIYATENTVILDIFVPYYNSQRCCTFYVQVSEDNGVQVLRVAKPPDLHARAVPYWGPKLRI